MKANITIKVKRKFTTVVSFVGMYTYCSLYRLVSFAIGPKNYEVDFIYIKGQFFI